MIRSILAVAVAAASLAACGAAGGKPYPDNVKQNMQTACVQGGAPTNVCDCIRSNIEKQIPFDDYALWDVKTQQAGKPDPASPLTDKIMKIGINCATSPVQ